PAVLQDAALLYARLSGFDSTQSRPTDAVRHAQMAVDFADQNVSLRQNAFGAREILAQSVLNLGVAQPSADWARRVSTFERAASLYGALAAEKPDNEDLTRDIGITARHLGSLY